MPNSRVAVVATLVALLALTACASAATPAAPADDRPVVLTTFTVLADMAGQVAGDDAVVTSLTGAGTEIHGYEPTPGDLRRATRADVLIANGLGLEAWLERLVAPLDLPTVVLSDGLEHPALHSRPGAHANPHAWMSPRVGVRYVERIADTLAALDPAHAAGYRSRATAYAAQVAALGDRLALRLAALPAQRRVLVTCEGAFGFLAHDAGLDEAYLWPVNAERQGTPRQVASVIRTVREREVPSVFCESTVAATAQRQVARETGAAYGGTLYVDSLSGPDGPVPSYLALLEHDVDVVVAGLTAEPGR